jgi:hypothetical protein
MTRFHEQPHESAGDFTTWLEVTQRPNRAAGAPSGSDVPCGECTACCRSSYFIHVQPHETGALARIPADLLFAAPGLPDGHQVMGHDEDGQCPMFVDGGCSIYEDRPQTCRDYDCRIFAATGIELDDDTKGEIVAQTHRWRFDTPTDLGRAQQSAVRASADHLRAHKRHLPAGSVPDDPTHLAMVAIEIHHVFISDVAGVPRCVEPEIDVVADALDAAMTRARLSPSR